MAYKVVLSRDEIPTKKGFFSKPKVDPSYLSDLKEVLMITSDKNVSNPLIRIYYLGLDLNINEKKDPILSTEPADIIKGINDYYLDNQKHNRLYIAAHSFVSAQFKAAAEKMADTMGKLSDFKCLDDFINAFEKSKIH